MGQGEDRVGWVKRGGAKLPFLVPLHFLVLFMSLIILFQLSLALSTILLIKSFQFQLNKLFPNRH